VAAVQYLASYLIHRIGTPLNVIEGRAAMIASGEVAEADLQRNARVIVEQSARITSLLRDFLAAPRQEPGYVTTFELGDLVKKAAKMLAPLTRARSATVSFERAHEPSTLYGNQDVLLVALTHVLERGIRATPTGGTLRLRLRNETKSGGPDGLEGRFACLEVDDEGPIIDTDALPALFKPPPAVRDSESTLGLFIAQAIAVDHGGWIDGANRSGKGARFTLNLLRGRDGQ
jgi:signal transduction histidine kinase